MLAPAPDDALLHRVSGERVVEIEICRTAGAVRIVDRVPADVRDRNGSAQPRDAPGYHAQSRDLVVLLAVVEQDLHAQADAEIWLLVRDPLAHEIVEV